MLLTFPHISNTETEFNTYNQSSFSKNRHSLFSLLNNHLVDYPTPLTLTYVWGLGSVAGIFLVFQIITGIILSLHYAPHISVAFDSLEHIMRDVNNGWLLRYLHSNGASFFFFVVYIHIARGLYYFSYIRSPIVWITGMAIFGLMMATAFLGYVLPWGQMSFWGATVITNLFSAIPLIGQEIAYWLWGGFSVDNPTLNRFFGLHFVLPFAIVGVVLLHLVFLHRVGSSNPLSLFDKNIDKIPFFPYFYWKDWVGLVLITWVYLYFVFFTPDALGHPDNYIEGNPMITPAHIVPEWYFLPYYAILRSIPNKLGGVIAMAAAIVFLFLLSIWGFIVTKWNKQEAYEYSFLFFHTSFSFNFLVWLFFFNVILLGWIGGQPVTPIIVLLGQINTWLYFWWLSYFPMLVVFPMKDFLKGFLFLSAVKKFILAVFLWNSMSDESSLLGQELNQILENLKKLFFIMPFYVYIVEDNFLTPYLLITIAVVLSLYFVVYKSPTSLTKKYPLELTLLLLGSLIPLFFLTKHNSNWVYFYLLFELSAMSTALLIASRLSPFSILAGLLYYFVSIITSAFLLLAILCFYIQTRTLDMIAFENWHMTLYSYKDMIFLDRLDRESYGNTLTWWLHPESVWAIKKWKEIGTLFLLLSFAIKIGIAPFHGWIISVSIGAPLNIMAYLQTIYKTALFFVLVFLWANTEPFYWTSHIFNFNINAPQLLFSAMGVITFLLATVSAFYQTGLKQFWSYASTGTIGFLVLLLGLELYALVLMYLLIYTLASTLFFTIILFYNRTINIRYLTDLQQLSVTPFLTFILSIVCFILAGVPPSFVFYLKLLGYYSILNELGLVALSIIILIHLVSIFLYVRVVKIVVFDKPTSAPRPVVPGIYDTITTWGEVIDWLALSTQSGLLLLLCVNWETTWCVVKEVLIHLIIN